MSSTQEDADADTDTDADQNTLEQHSLRIALVGEPNVGKTNIIKRFCYNDFVRIYSSTVGAEFHMKRLKLNTNSEKSAEISVRITDVGGLEVRGAMLDKYLFNCNMILLVYDITNPTSFDYLSHWVGNITSVIRDAPIVAILANKCDLEHQRAVRLDKTRQFLKEYSVDGYTMSAKTGENVTASLLDVIAKHLGIRLSKTDKERQTSILRAEIVTNDSRDNMNNSTIVIQHKVAHTLCLLQ